MKTKTKRVLLSTLCLCLVMSFSVFLVSCACAKEKDPQNSTSDVSTNSTSEVSTNSTSDVVDNSTSDVSTNSTSDVVDNSNSTTSVTVEKPSVELSLKTEFALSREYDGERVDVTANDYSYTGDGTVNVTWYKKGSDIALGNAPENAGEYKITLSSAETANYASKSVDYEYVITKKNLQIDEIQKSYLSGVVYNGGTDISDRLTLGKLTGLIARDVTAGELGTDTVYIDQALTTATLEDKNVGPAVGYTIKYVLAGENKDNYNAPANDTGKTNVVPLPLKASVNLVDPNLTKEYDGSDILDKNLFTVELTNAVSGDDVSLKVKSATLSSATPAEQVEVIFVLEDVLEGKDKENYIIPTKVENYVRIDVEKKTPVMNVNEGDLFLPCESDFGGIWYPDDAGYIAEYGTRIVELLGYGKNPLYGSEFPEEPEYTWLGLSSLTDITASTPAKLVYRYAGNEYYNAVINEYPVQLVESTEINNEDGNMPSVTQNANTIKWYKFDFNTSDSTYAFSVNNRQDLDVKIYRDNLSMRDPTIDDLYYTNYLMGETIFVRVITGETALDNYELFNKESFKVDEINATDGGDFAVLNNTQSETTYAISKVVLPNNGKLMVTSITDGVKVYEYKQMTGVAGNELKVGSVIDYNTNQNIIFSNYYLVFEVPASTNANISFANVTTVSGIVNLSNASVIDIESTNVKLNSGEIIHEKGSSIADHTKAVFLVKTSSGGAKLQVVNGTEPVTSKAIFNVYNQDGTQLINGSSNCQVTDNVNNEYLVVEVTLHYSLDSGSYTICEKE